MPYAADPRDRAKSAAIVIALHAGLGAGLIFGLAGDRVRQAAESLKSFDVLEPPPPPQPEPPPPDESESAAKDEAAPPDLRSKPAPVVAPTPVPLPSPVRTSDERAPIEGSDRSAGAAAVAGPGTGAGGTGSGFGGGGRGGEGSGSGAGLDSPARLLRGMRSRLDSSLLRGLPADRGEVVLVLSVGPDGRVASCRPLGSSGSPALDAELCRRMAERSRWEPARDRAGRPVAVSLRYTATWSKD